jgi:hypothetical protein
MKLATILTASYAFIVATSALPMSANAAAAELGSVAESTAVKDLQGASDNLPKLTEEEALNIIRPKVMEWVGKRRQETAASTIQRYYRQHRQRLADRPPPEVAAT